jgi:MipA family protein
MRRWCRFPQIATGLAAVVLGLAARESGAAEIDPRTWDFELGIATAYAPFYSGARATGPRLRVWADGAYRTGTVGTLALDSGSLTIAPEARWDFVDSQDVGIGLLVGYREGRNDRNPTFTSSEDGSTRLLGLPTIRGIFDAGAAGHATVLGIPFFAQFRTALYGPQGTQINIGAYLPLKLKPDFELTILPTLTWADSRQMRAFYGVSSGADTASGFSSYDPSSGWENAAIEIGGNWRMSTDWHVIVSIAYQRILGNAARSPIVQTSNQTSALAGLAFDF